VNPSRSASSIPQASTRPHLLALDGLRFVAAMHIVLFHTIHIAGLRLVTWGSTSTSLFFILSGFILTYVYTAEGGGLRVSAREFWWRRLARLYPLSVLSQLIAIPFVWYHYAPVERLPRAAAALTGTQGWFPPIADSFNSPGWSVAVFTFCYLMFPLVAAATRGWSARRLGVALAGAWAWCLLPVAAYLWLGGGGAWLAALNHHPFSRFPEFLFGVLLARLFVSLPRLRVPRGTAGAAVALLAAALLLLPVSVFPLAHNGLLAPLHALLIVGCAGGGGVLARVLATRPLREMGSASFALFLLHVPLYAWTLMPLAPVLDPQPLPVRAAAYLGYLVLAVTASWMVQRRVADPIAGALRRGSSRPAAHAPSPATARVT
jgi:peptidoglycan/LPS O-acetylase OafA/YrhL